MERKLLSVGEAADLLGVSRTTFNKIRKENNFSEVIVGRRARFYQDELLAALRSNSTTTKGKQAVPTPSNNANVILNIFSNETISKIEVSKNVFDLTALKQIDPYGAVSLLCAIIDRARTENLITLLVNDGITCQSLKTLHFFYQIESQCGQKVHWEKETLAGASFQDTNLLMPIKAVTAKGAERTLAENLVALLRKQGFNDSVGRGIAQIIGELADNAMTHSAPTLSDRVCFVAAQRFLYQEKNCIIVGLADPGLGIHKTLRSNEKYKNLTDENALLRAFRPFVSSWDAKRGKGLADVLGIALGNKSYLHADSGDFSLQMDFHNRVKPLIKFSDPLASVPGTRFGLILIDNHFEKCTREEVEKMLVEKESELL